MATLREIVETALSDAYQRGAKDWDESAHKKKDWSEVRASYVAAVLPSYLTAAGQDVQQSWNSPPYTSISYETALEHWNDRSNGADEGRSTSKGGRAWLCGEFQLCELEALCIVLRHEAGTAAEGIAELLHNMGPIDEKDAT